MIIIKQTTDSNYVKASVTDLMTPFFVRNNKLSIRNREAFAIAPSTSLNIISIKYDQKLIAPIIRNTGS